MPVSRKKSWREKLADDKDLPKIVQVKAVAAARKHGTESACPITTGIFSWIAAHAAEEARAAGEKAPTPCWRTLKSGGELNPKYPGGIAAARRKLAAEGHAFVRKGTRVFVLAYDLKNRTSRPLEPGLEGTRHSTAVAHNGRIYVVGGNTDEQGLALDLVQVFELRRR